MDTHTHAPTKSLSVITRILYLEFFEAASHLDTVGSYRKELLVNWVALHGLEVSVESTEKC